MIILNKYYYYNFIIYIFNISILIKHLYKVEQAEVTFDPAIKAMPTDSLRFCPPDSVCDWASRLCSSPRTRIISATSPSASFELQPFNWK